jgi:dihydrofolate reductase
VLAGRRTFDTMVSAGQTSMPGMKIVVFSKTLRPADYPKFQMVAENLHETVSALKAQPGKDIWLFGGGSLFRSLAAEGLVDTVEVAVIPVLLGEGVPLLPGPTQRIKLSLRAQRTYKTGIVSLEYAVT